MERWVDRFLHYVDVFWYALTIKPPQSVNLTNSWHRRRSCSFHPFIHLQGTKSERISGSTEPLGCYCAGCDAVLRVHILRSFIVSPVFVCHFGGCCITHRRAIGHVVLIVRVCSGRGSARTSDVSSLFPRRIGLLRAAMLMLTCVPQGKHVICPDYDVTAYALFEESCHSNEGGAVPRCHGRFKLEEIPSEKHHTLCATGV